MEFSPLSEYRCNCGKLLFKALLSTSVVEIKCKRCGMLNIFKSEEKEPPSLIREKVAEEDIVIIREKSEEK